MGIYFIYLKKLKKNLGQVYPCKEPNSNRASAIFDSLLLLLPNLKKG
jgi:hypothetical protein